MGLRWGFFCIILFAFCGRVVAHVCIQDSVYNVEDIMASPQPYAGSYPNATNTLPIRLRIDSSYLANDLLGFTCTHADQTVPNPSGGASIPCNNYVLTTALQSYLNDLLDKAQALFEHTLLVMPVQAPLILTGGTQGLYGGVIIDGAYTSGLAATDMVIFATARPILSSDTLAVARVVQEDQYKRPVLGHLNINPAGVKDTSISMFAYNFGVVIHEMSHALGFTFGKFQSVNPDPNTGITDITKVVTLNVGAGDVGDSRTIIASPRVVAWARQYYGCNTMQGVELENQGGSGTALSHWEKRIANNEYMTGTASRNPVFSELTLALFEDSGWYRVNYSMAGTLLWGQGMGCDFALRSCPNWPRYQGYFCSDSGDGCTADYQAKGACQLATGTVPSIYQYFPGEPTKIGLNEYPDYCPITVAYDNEWCFDPNAKGSTFLKNGEVFGENSRCFNSDLVKDSPVGAKTGQVCYESYCTAPDELRVKVGSYWYECPPQSSIRVIGYGGTLSCPKRIEQVCASSPVDDSWPVFLTISPNAGGPGLHVNISGRNFLEGMTVRIDDPLADVVVVSSTLIMAKIPDSDRFQNPTNIIEQKESVILTDLKGRSTVGYNKFTIKVALNSDYFRRALNYLANNWLITGALIAAVVVTILVCGYCCYRQKGKAEEADTEYYA